MTEAERVSDEELEYFIRHWNSSDVATRMARELLDRRRAEREGRPAAWLDCTLGQRCSCRFDPTVQKQCGNYIAPPSPHGTVSDFKEHLSTIKQAFLEVAHAQYNGSAWYTRGESGLYQQVAMWVRKGNAAVDAIGAAQEAKG